MKKKLSIFLVVVILVAAGGYLFTLYDNKFPYGRMWETPAIRPHEQKIPQMEKGIVPFDGGEIIYRQEPGEKIHFPLDVTDASVVALGKVLYVSYCMQCHGKYHDGNGTVGQSFAPLPGDLRSPKVQAMAEGIFFKEISYGIAGGRQPALATTIAVDDRWKIIAYVKSLGVRSGGE